MESIQSIVSTHPFLEKMAPEELEILLKGAEITEFAPGDIIFREGEYADKFYLIDEGKIALECHSSESDVVIETIEAGDVLGWSWLFPPFSWHFQARAIERTIALKLNGAHILIAAESNARFGYELMKRFAQLLIHRLQETRKRLIERREKAEVEIGDAV